MRNVLGETITSTSDKIKKLLELYPPERINNLRQRLDAFWDGKPLEGFPFTLRRRDVPVGLDHNAYELGVFTPGEVLSTQLDDRLIKAILQDAYVPSLITGNSPYYLSFAFGAKMRKLVRGVLVSQPLVQTAEEIDKLEVPDFSKVPEGPFRQCMQQIDYFLEKTRGLIPLTLPDPQGPMSLAAQLWNQEEFFVSMVNDPQSVHRIMRLCTNAVIAFFCYLFSSFGREHFLTIHCMPYLYRKEGAGVALSEDMFGVLSPAHLNEFLIPYLNEISNKFGSLVLHSCGDCSQKFFVAHKIQGLAGVNFGQTNISMVSTGDIGNLGLLSPNDWTSRQQIAHYVQLLRNNAFRGWIQVQTIEGEIDQEAEGVGIKQWADLANYLESMCRFKA